jgi:hypothetical protein
MLKIVSYGCSTSAGPTVEDYWAGLCNQKDHSVASRLGGRVCQWPKSPDLLAIEVLTKELGRAFQELTHKFPIPASGTYGIILASTKGCIDDFIWNDNPSEQDPVTPVLKKFIQLNKLQPKVSLCVSNACASSLIAVQLAKQWIESKRVSHVLILAADMIGPFVNRGFQTLKAMAVEKAKPFDQARQGFYLGDSACVLLLTGETDVPGQIVRSVASDTEGFAVTRPSTSGESLRRAIEKLGGDKPDLVIAHGTATLANDLSEDRALTQSIGENVPVTCTKWSVGHTLGASGAMDLIAACEILRNKKVFPIGNTSKIDPELKSNFMLNSARPFDGKRVLITSLGFGGVHAAAMIEGDR